MVTVQVAVLPLTTGASHVLELDAGAGDTVVPIVPNETPEASPGSAVTTMVNVWACPTSFTPLGAIWMLASTQLLVAGPELPCVLSVERVTVTPPIVTWPVALTVTVCTVELLTVTVQEAERPFSATVGLAQVLAVKVAPLGVIEKLLAVWLPGSAFRVMVKVCEWPTSLTPLGAIWM